MPSAQENSPGPGKIRARPEPRRVSSRELLAQGQPLYIEHQGQTYQLRQTRAGKLLLTK